MTIAAPAPVTLPSAAASPAEGGATSNTSAAQDWVATRGTINIRPDGLGGNATLDLAQVVSNGARLGVGGATTKLHGTFNCVEYVGTG